MANFENFAAVASQLENEIAHKGAVLGIDWSNGIQVRELARQALDFDAASLSAGAPLAAEQLARVEIFGLAHLMQKVMASSADEGLLTHGGPVWKAFASALWEEIRARGG